MYFVFLNGLKFLKKAKTIINFDRIFYIICNFDIMFSAICFTIFVSQRINAQMVTTQRV